MKKMTKTAILIFFMLLFSKILGFCREMLLAYKFGAGSIVDAYNVSISLPNVLFAVFASGLSQSYIPVLSRIDDKKKARFFCNVFNIILVVSSLLSCICFFFAPQVVRILAPGFSGESNEIAIYFIRIIVWLLPFYTTFTIISAHLQFHESFIVPNFCDYIIVNVGVIISTFLASKEFILPLMLGQVLSMAIAEVVVYVFFKNNNYGQYKFIFNLRDSDFRVLLKLAIPLGISVMANQINAATDKMFSSMLTTGTTSALGYANRIQTLFLTLTTTVFISLCFPRINRAFSEKKKNEGYYYIRKAFSLTLFLALPFSVFLYTYAADIVRLLFERGAFNINATSITAECLRYYSLGIIFYALCEVESKTLAANLKQKLILKNTVITVFINILLDFIFVKAFRHIGLALATSLSGIVSFILLYIDMRKNEINVINVINKDDRKETCQLIVITACSLLGSYYPYRLISNRMIAFLMAGLIFLAAYCLGCLIFKIPVFMWLAKLLLKRKDN